LARFSGTKRAMTTPGDSDLFFGLEPFQQLGVTIPQFANSGGFHVAPKL
jgi:hypothetical protein